MSGVLPLHQLDMQALQQAFLDHVTSPTALLTSLYERIERLDPSLHAYACLTWELAFEQAAQSEQAFRDGRSLGPLHGVPIGIKDLCWVAGYPAACGTRVYKDFVPTVDATVVARLKEAGAIIVGKLQMTEGAFALHHEDYPVPVNPWGAAHWSGASSSGSGVALAAGLCYGAIGTDTGGSIRFPCAANGLTGIKPTWGRVSRHGVFDFAPSLDHVGSMARNARDAALMLSVMAGYDPLDTSSLSDDGLDLPLDAQDLSGVRIGVDWTWNEDGVDASIVSGMREALSVLKTLGAKETQIQFPDARAVVNEWEFNAGVEVALAHADTYPAQQDIYGPALARLIEMGRGARAVDFHRVLQNRARFTGAMNRLMSSIDLLVLPVQPYAAPTYEQLGALAEDPEANSRLIQFTAPIDSSGHPSITLPCGFTEAGLPIGFQLVARHGQEALLCRAGIAFQQLTRWHTCHPAV